MKEGYSPEEIVQALRDDGYSKEEIKKMISNVRKEMNNQKQEE